MILISAGSLNRKLRKSILYKFILDTGGCKIIWKYFHKIFNKFIELQQINEIT